jgi:radical SAM superfamily enzyme YgiQ (UPF0313 family)
MRTLLIGINSKYIHTNLAIRHLKANCDFVIDIKEFTIKDNIYKIYNNIIEYKPDVLAISVYIWNIEIVRELLNLIKSNKVNLKIILGGPEVSYESDDFLLNNFCDFIIVNEGEIAFNMLIDSLTNNLSFEAIPNLNYLKNNKVVKTVRSEIHNLNDLNNPYHFDNEDIPNKIQYIELSRGCPYNCSYCLASLEKTVRKFDIERVKSDIKYLYSKGAKTFKFLDRTFNLLPNTALELFKYIVDNNFNKAVFQFEISGDILNNDLIEYLVKHAPKDLIRFEIGIQSIHDSVNNSVNRKQDTKKLFKNITRLASSNVDLHLDLIAGLPYENLEMFKETFNETFLLYPKELQLGFLKLLKGTRLYYQKDDFGYIVSNNSPYEIIKNNYLSKEDILEIKCCEEGLEVFWNKGFMNQSIRKIISNQASPFEFFSHLGKMFFKNKANHNYQLYELFDFLEKKYIEYRFDIRLDYLSYSKIKPKIYWDNSKVKKNEIIRLFHEQNKEYNLDSLYKYSMVTKYKDDYLIVIYFQQHKEIKILKA